jgi:hypothetical protein
MIYIPNVWFKPYSKRLHLPTWREYMYVDKGACQISAWSLLLTVGRITDWSGDGYLRVTATISACSWVAAFLFTDWSAGLLLGPTTRVGAIFSSLENYPSQNLSRLRARPSPPTYPPDTSHVSVVLWHILLIRWLQFTLTDSVDFIFMSPQ